MQPELGLAYRKQSVHVSQYIIVVVIIRDLQRGVF